MDPSLLAAERRQRQNAQNDRDQARGDAEARGLQSGRRTAAGAEVERGRREELEKELAARRRQLQETTSADRRRYDALAEELLVAKKRHAEVAASNARLKGATGCH